MGLTGICWQKPQHRSTLSVETVSIIGSNNSDSFNARVVSESCFISRTVQSAEMTYLKSFKHLSRVDYRPSQSLLKPTSHRNYYRRAQSCFSSHSKSIWGWRYAVSMHVSNACKEPNHCSLYIVNHLQYSSRSAIRLVTFVKVLSPINGSTAAELLDGIRWVS